jgi:hypothetical protein
MKPGGVQNRRGAICRGQIRRRNGARRDLDAVIDINGVARLDHAVEIEAEELPHEAGGALSSEPSAPSTF